MTDIFDFEEKISRYAVMGNPIKHSRSPQIHSQFASQTQQKIVYDAIHVDLGGFTQAVRNFQANGGNGLNVTIPFKLEAYKLADNLSSRAQQAGAVNTLIFEEDGRVTGDNTDGQGLVDDLVSHLNWPIAAKKVLILGAGGASRGILQPILEQHPECVFIANRTASKAKELADEFSLIADQKGVIKGGGYSDIKNSFDLIINATSASLSGKLPPLSDNLITPDTFCYDMMYAAQATAFMQWASNLGALNVADGLGMLVGQAAESFYLWRNVRPEVTPVISLIRQQMT
ncbi:MAG: shikimate dehydrogenase [Pseudomonadota bacterium]